LLPIAPGIPCPYLLSEGGVLRAVLRLARSSVKPVVFDRENAAFRDIGRRLSVVRHADVLVEVIEGLRPDRTRDLAFATGPAPASTERRS
jgi:hypothetical protein